MKLTVIGETVQIRGGSMLRSEGAGEEDVSRSGVPAEPTFEVHRLPGGRHALSLSGRLPQGWTGALSLSLSQAGITIIQGFAKKVQDRIWVAEFEIEPARGDLVVESMDFVAMAVSSARAPGLRRLALSSFGLGEPDAHGGAIYLEVRGLDQVGFLAELLGQLAFLTFFPEEMIVQTSGDQVFDRFLLKGVGGHVPPAGACQALSKWLEGLRTP